MYQEITIFSLILFFKVELVKNTQRVDFNGGFKKLQHLNSVLQKIINIEPGRTHFIRKSDSRI